MGWNGSGGGGAAQPLKPIRNDKRHSSVVALAVGLLVVVGAILAFVFLSGEGEAPTQNVVKREGGKIREHEPAKVAAEVLVPEKESRPTPKKEDLWLGQKVTRRVAETNGDMIVETIYTVDGKVHKFFNDQSKPVFQHASDQILAMVTANQRGDMAPLPALGKNFENEFADSLKTEIVINDDDPEDVKEAKERVKRARQELLDAMGAGMKAEDVIYEHRKMVEDNAATRMQVVKGLREIIDKGDMEGAREYVEKMNPALESMGIMQIEIPKSREEARAERLQRIAEKHKKEQEQQK